MDEDGGVLGRLPRSRPGTRSEKREGQAESGAGGAAGGSRRKPERGAQPKAPRAQSKATRAQPKPAHAQGTGPKAARAKQASAPGARPKTTRAEPSNVSGGKAERAAKSERRAADPVVDVARSAGQVAGAGFRVAGTLAQELLRRLPRR